MQGGSLRALVSILVLLGALVPVAEGAHNNQPPPVAEFIWAPESPVAGQDVHFLDQSFRMGGKPIYRAIWRTSDDQYRIRGYPINMTTPREAFINFSQPGTYDVMLTIYDHGGHTDTKTKSITVRPAPAAAITMVQDGPTVSVKAEASSPYAPIVSYSWNWGDGTPNGTTASAEHRYDRPGNFTIRLVVTDQARNPGRAQAVVSLADPEPVAALTVNDGIVVAERPLVFQDVSRLSAFSPLATRAWLVDGAETGDGAALTHVFDAPGWHNVTLRVTDASGRASEATIAVRVIAPPVAVFSATVEERTVMVTASEASDPYSGALAYAWDWGDGSAPGEGVQARHEYEASGVYVVNLTVSNSDGLAASFAQEIAIAGSGLVVAFDVNPQPAKAGQTVRFVDASVPPEGGIRAWSWELGDGTTAAGVSAQHAYAEGGRYLVNLTVTGANGDQARLSRVVVIESLPPPTPATPRPTPGTPTATTATPGPAEPTSATPTASTPDEPVRTTGTPTPAVTAPVTAQKPTPAPGVLGILLALGAALVVLTRRR